MTAVGSVVHTAADSAYDDARRPVLPGAVFFVFWFSLRPHSEKALEQRLFAQQRRGIGGRARAAMLGLNQLHLG